MSILQDFRRSASANQAPVTTAIVVVLVASFLAAWMRIGLDWMNGLTLVTDGAFGRPWTFLTYPYVGMGSFAILLFGALWLWGIGGALERDLGSKRLAGLWILFAALSGACVWAGAGMLGERAVLLGPAAPIAAVTVMWGTRNPSARVMLLFVLPITGKWLAWLSAAFVIFGTEPPTLAPFAALPLALAYFLAAERMPISPSGAGSKSGKSFVRGTGFYSKDYFEDVDRRKRAREEQEKLKKLFERSSKDDRQEDGSSTS